jgi:hypothetical protein
MFGSKNRKIRNSELLEETRTHYQRLKKLSKEAASKRSDNRNERGKETNSKCPSCGSTNVNDRIKRLQGDFEGKGSVAGFGILGTGVMSGSYSSKGSIDTNEVNKCNEPSCNHEWKKEKEYNYVSSTEELDSRFSNISYVLNEFHCLKRMTLDKNDLDETFNSLEEKKADKKKSIIEGYNLRNAKEYFADIPMECILEMAKREVWRYSSYTLNSFESNWNVKLLEELGFKHIKYSV